MDKLLGRLICWARGHDFTPEQEIQHVVTEPEVTTVAGIPDVHLFPGDYLYVLRPGTLCRRCGFRACRPGDE